MMSGALLFAEGLEKYGDFSTMWESDFKLSKYSFFLDYTEEDKFLNKTRESLFNNFRCVVILFPDLQITELQLLFNPDKLKCGLSFRANSKENWLCRFQRVRI